MHKKKHIQIKFQKWSRSISSVQHSNKIKYTTNPTRRRASALDSCKCGPGGQRTQVSSGASFGVSMSLWTLNPVTTRSPPQKRYPSMSIKWFFSLSQCFFNTSGLSTISNFSPSLILTNWSSNSCFVVWSRALSVLSLLGLFWHRVRPRFKG